MTDADVDGAHIAALLMTFFIWKCHQLLKMVIYFAQPPLYRLSLGNVTEYASDENEKGLL